jgi:serine/threonine-protein kinase
MIGKRQRIAGRYLLETEIGSGGMGVVWRAHDERLGRDVAVKLLAANTLGNDVARARLVREARAAGRLQHEGIVHVYDVGETEDGGAFLVMELISGHGLRDWIADGQLSLVERIELVIAIAAALQCAHELGVVHRDVKPDNVLVRTNNRPVLLDFGLAKPIATPLVETSKGEESLRLTGTGNIVGTPAYLAPEQVKGETVGAAADQFSLAVMTFELLTGRLPWNGKTVIEVIASMLHDQPLSAEDLVPELPAGLDAVLHRAMSKPAGERFPSVAEFVDALRALFPEAAGPRLSSLPPPSPRARPSLRDLHGRLGSAETGVAKKVVSAPTSARNRLHWFAVLLLGIAALIGIGIAAERNRHATVAPSARALPTPAALPADAVVACPLFKVSGELPDPASGWLSAAAAALACDRVQVLRGGASDRTLAPAELIDGIPREPNEDAPADAFEAPGLVERTTAAAKQRAAAYIEGAVNKAPLEFSVELTLRAKDGRELARSRARGDELFEAISSVVREMRAAFGNGSASSFQKEWLRVDTTEAALDVLDVTTALLVETDLATIRACERAGRQRALKPEMAYLIRAVCHERLKRAPLPDEPPPVDTSSTGALVTTISAQRTRGGPEATKKRVDQLRAAEPALKSGDERAILLATAAELLYNIGDLAGAQSAARVAGQAAPKLVDPRGTPWHRLAYAAQFDRAIARVHAAWIPWEPIVMMNGMPRDGDLASRAKLHSRAAVLCQRGFYAAAYGEVLAARGKTEEARNIAERLDDDYLRVRAYVGDTQYRRGLELATRALAELPAEDLNAGKAFRLAAAGAEAARYLGRPAKFVDDLVRRFIEAEPPHVRVGVAPFFSLIYACLEAPKPVAGRCVARLRQLYQRGDFGGVVSTAPLVIDGAERWIAGDAAGAAKAWRPMLRQGAHVGQAPFRHVLAAAFDRASMTELATAVDAPFVQLVEHQDAVDLAFARAALRAQKAGDLEQARKLARACVARWQHADDDVPLRKEMQALLTRAH